MRTLSIARTLATRLRLVNAVSAGALGFAAGGSLAAIVLLVSTRVPAWHATGPWVAGGLTVLGAIAGLMLGWRRAVPLSRGTGRADEALGLHDRLTSAVELSIGREREGSARAGSPFADLLYRESEEAADRVRPREIVPIPLHRGWGVGLAVLLVGVAGWVFLPVRTESGAGPGSGPARVAIAEADDALAETIAAFDPEPRESTDADPADGSRDGLTDELDTIRERLARGEVDPEDALAEAASELERAAALADEAGEDTTAETIADAARSAEQRVSPASGELADALASGDLERARDAARDLLRGSEGMPPEARERIARDLTGLADALDESLDASRDDPRTDAPGADDPASPTQGPPLADALRERVEDLADPEQVAEELEREGVEPEAARELADQIARDERDRRRDAQTREEIEQLRDALDDASRELDPSAEDERTGAEPPAPDTTPNGTPDANPDDAPDEGIGEGPDTDPATDPDTDPADTPAEEPRRTRGESPSDAPRDPTGRSPEGAPEQRPGKKAGDQTGDQTGEKSGEQRGEQGGEQGGEQANEQTGKQPDQQSGQQPSEQPGEQPGEQTSPAPGEQPSQQPEQTPGERSTPSSQTDPTGKPGDEPAPDGTEPSGEGGTERSPSDQPEGQKPGNQQPGDRPGGRPDSSESTEDRNDEGSSQSGDTQSGDTQPGEAQPGVTGQQEQDGPVQDGETDGMDSGRSGGGSNNDERGIDRLSETLDRLAESQRDRRAQREASDEMRERAQELLDKASPEQREKLEDLAKQFAERDASRFKRPTAYDAGRETVDARDPDNQGPDAREQTLSEWFNPEGDPAEGVDRSARSPNQLREAAESAERAVEQQRVPPRYRKLVREVFKNMRERAGQSDGGAPVLGDDAEKAPPPTEKKD